MKKIIPKNDCTTNSKISCTQKISKKNAKYTYIWSSIIAEKNTCSSVSENEGGCKKSNYIYLPMKKEEFLESAKVSF